VIPAMVEIKNPTAEQIAEVGERYKGRSARGDEWSVGWLNEPGESVRWYSGVGSEVYAMAKRLSTNPSACRLLRDHGDGVSFLLDPDECRSPATIVRPTSKARRSERSDGRFGPATGGAE